MVVVAVVIVVETGRGRELARAGAGIESASVNLTFGREVGRVSSLSGTTGHSAGGEGRRRLEESLSGVATPPRM